MRLSRTSTHVGGEPETVSVQATEVDDDASSYNYTLQLKIGDNTLSMNHLRPSGAPAFDANSTFLLPYTKPLKFDWKYWCQGVTATNVLDGPFTLQVWREPS